MLTAVEGVPKELRAFSGGDDHHAVVSPVVRGWRCVQVRGWVLDCAVRSGCSAMGGFTPASSCWDCGEITAQNKNGW
jgi:hypothetical protein